MGDEASRPTGVELALRVAINDPSLTPEDYERAKLERRENRKAMGWRGRFAVWRAMQRVRNEPAGNWYEPDYLGGGFYESDDPDPR